MFFHFTTISPGAGRLGDSDQREHGKEEYQTQEIS